MMMPTLVRNLKAKKSALGGLLFGLLFSIDAYATVVASVLPVSRSVQVGQTATAFATLINAGTETAVNCGLAAPAGLDAVFSSRTTNPATNLPIEPAQERIDIAPGGFQTYVFGFQPNSPIASTTIDIVFDCDNTDPALSIDGLNTLQLSASDTPVPDIVALAATLANDGVVRTPGTAGTGVFSIALANVGATGTMTVIPELSGATGNAFVCETDPLVGNCISPIGVSVETEVAAGATPTFGIFMQAQGRQALDPAAVRVRVDILDAGGVSRGSTSVAYQTQTAVASGGGTLMFDGVVVESPTNATIGPLDIDVQAQASPPAPLPAGFATASTTRNVSVSDETLLDAAMQMVLSYDASLPDDQIFVLHYNEATSTYEPVTMLAQDAEANTVTVDSRNFSPFVVATQDSTLPTTFSVSGFDPTNAAWNIRNFGSYFAPGGNCLGMSGYAVWFFNNQTQNLSAAYSTAGGAPTSIAHLAATRAHLAQSQYWAIQQFRNLDAQSDADVANSMKAALSLFNRPIVLLLGINGSPRHATVLYGYDETGFLHYDVNSSPGTSRTATVPFDGTNFGTYAGFNSFGFVAEPSLGRSQDFADLATEAAAGFTNSSDLLVSAPTQDEEVVGTDARLTGSLAGALAGGRDIVAYVNGQPTPLGQGITTFNTTIPVKSGENTLVLVAGDLANQNRWSKNAATQVLTFDAQIAATLFRATLTWRQDNTDLDLYVTEPSGETSWYADSVTSNGMELDFDNTTGFGPENTRVETGDTVLPGNYIVRVHFFSGNGPVSGTVQLLLNEGSEQQVNQDILWSISADGNFGTDGPGNTGPEWVDIATVDVQSGLITPN